MDRLTPIETTYRGYRFRSRLEARWAVAFDHDHPLFTWEYEPEGFKVNGTWYLPDFRVRWDTDTYSWVEIKPDNYQATSREHQTYQAMANGAQGGLYLLRGINPGYRMYRPHGHAPIEELDTFVSVEALRAGRSARFEHGARVGGHR